MPRSDFENIALNLKEAWPDASLVTFCKAIQRELGGEVPFSTVRRKVLRLFKDRTDQPWKRRLDAKAKGELLEEPMRCKICGFAVAHTEQGALWLYGQREVKGKLYHYDRCMPCMGRLPKGYQESQDDELSPRERKKAIRRRRARDLRRPYRERRGRKADGKV